MRVRTMWRERELASSRRSGAWSRRQARELQNAFLRRNRRALLIVGLIAIAVTPISLLMPEHVRWMFFGIWPTAIIAMVIHWVIVGSGAARLVMADQGEQWTREELKAARKRGWKIVHRVLFRRYGDIDTVAIGTPGVVVIETKWSSEDWTSPKQQRWLDAAVDQAARNAALVEQQIRQEIGPAPTWAVVVLWPSPADLDVREINGVTVMPGLELRAWIASLPHGAIERERVNAAWAFLERHVTKRDAHDLETLGPMPRSPLQYLIDILLYPIGALTGVFIVSLLLNIVRWPLTLLPAAIAVSACAWASRFATLRRASIAAALAITGVLTALLIIVGVALVVQ